LKTLRVSAARALASAGVIRALTTSAATDADLKKQSAVSFIIGVPLSSN
jgi:hypothetical protein